MTRDIGKYVNSCDICQRMKNYILYKATSRKVEVEWSTRKTIDIFDSKFHHKITVSSREQYNSSSLQYVVKNNTFYGNNKGNNSKRTNKTV